MENTTTETQTQTTTAPAPVTDKAQVTPAPAPVTTDKTAPETVAKTPSENKPDPKELARQAFQSREQKREKKASEELAEWKQKYAELETKLNTNKPAAPEPEAEIDFLDDPKKALEKTEERAMNRTISELERRQKEYEAQVHYRQVSEKAADFLLTRSHLKEDPAFKEDVLKVIAEKYLHLAAEDGARDPQAASRLAYLDVCAAKGIVPDMEGFKHTAPMNASGGKATSGVPLSAPATGKRVFAKGEVKNYLNEVPTGTPEWERRLAETEEAYREGRVNR